MTALTPDQAPAILAWARTAIAPVNGAFKALHPHELAAPVVHALLKRANLQAEQIDALVLGNALGAGGNPARMTALAAGLPQHCAALSIDSQCCAGLDAISVAVGLLQSGQANVVIAGGAEAWSRAPIRQTRPLEAAGLPQSYERPAFAPDPAQDPDLLQAAADYAAQHGISRSAQEAYALLSHQRALHAQAAMRTAEIVPIAGLTHDAYPRVLSAERAARLPVIARSTQAHPTEDCSLSALTISAKADGAALVLLASAKACQRLGLQPAARWVASSSRGGNPAMPLSVAASAAQQALANADLLVKDLHAIELHDAFAVQGIAFANAFGIAAESLNTDGGGVARGHPIGASGAVSLVRLLSQLQNNQLGLAAIAGAGGLGAACVVRMERKL